MKVVALAGGVGGAKLADGLYRVLPGEDLTVIVNCGDDFTYQGLRICPDLDTVCYALAGLANPVTGWGRSDESWVVFEQIQKLGGPGWFHLGDLDLATHLERTRRLLAGDALSGVTVDFCKAWGVHTRVLPVTDNSVPTYVNTKDEGRLPFQEYFVKLGCVPVVTDFEFQNASSARPAPGVMDAILNADCLVVCPSNPWVSISPILSIPGVLDAVMGCPVRIGISPIVGGKALKGPAAKMYAELGITPSALAVARQYRGWCSDFVLDAVDDELRAEIEHLGMAVLVTDTIMDNTDARTRVARDVLDYCQAKLHRVTP